MARALSRPVRWTARDIDRLHAMIARGWSYKRIARRLGRTHCAIIARTKQEGISHKRSRGTYSARQVAALLGVTVWTIGNWIDRGWLKAANAGTRERPFWRVDHFDLLAFLEHDETWVAWAPNQITDAGLERYARELRAGPRRWLSVVEVAARYGVSPAAVWKWVRTGLLTAVEYNAYFIRAADLAGFVIPSEREQPEQVCPACGKVVRGLAIHRGRMHKEGEFSGRATV